MNDPTTPTGRLAPRIPRHVLNLNALAETAGMTTSLAITPYSDDPELRIWSTWEGTKTQLFSTGLLTPCQQRKLLVQHRYRLSVPSGGHHMRNCIATGEISVDGEQVSWELDCGPALYTINEQNGCEIVTYEDQTLYHGSVETLIAAGIGLKRLPLGKQRAREESFWSGNILERNWASRRQPDGLFVYRVESEAAARRRVARFEAWETQSAAWAAECAARTPTPQAVAIKKQPGHLRLVVDNTRGVQS